MPASAMPPQPHLTGHDEYRRQMDVNFFGTVNVVGSLLDHFQTQRSGRIAAVSSVAGFMGLYGYTAYAAAKFAQTGYMDSLRQEMEPFGVGVSIVFPGDTDTPMLAAEQGLRPRGTLIAQGKPSMMNVETVAAAILDGLNNGKPVILPGTTTKLIHVANRFVPELMRGGMIRSLKKGDPEMLCLPEDPASAETAMS